MWMQMAMQKLKTPTTTNASVVSSGKIFRKAFPTGLSRARSALRTQLCGTWHGSMDNEDTQQLQA
jgi:hypothetical protein